jgi:hypothetical protein
MRRGNLLIVSLKPEMVGVKQPTLGKALRSNLAGID